MNCANKDPVPYHSPTKALMCLHPIQIPNPNYGLDNVEYGFMKDTVSKYILIPCRHCPECYANMQMQLVQRVQMECLDQHAFFCTLTYNNESMPYLEIPSTDGKSVRSIRYSDVSDLQNMFKRLRKRNAFGRPFRYLAVSELGSKRARPHFHVLFFIPRYKDDDFNTCLNLEDRMFKAVLLEWRRNYSSDWRRPDYRPLCTFQRKWTRRGLSSTFDLHYANERLSDNGIADVGFYITKYMTKPGKHAERLQQALHMNLDLDSYEDVWSIIKPRFFASIGFGVNPVIDAKSGRIKSLSPTIVEYLRNCVQKSIGQYDSPRFINPVNGQTFPLSRYYYSFGEIYSYMDSMSFWFNSRNPDQSNVNDSFDKRDRREVLVKEDIFNQRTSRLIDQNYFDFDSLF